MSCLHCGLPAPGGESFCCPGCRAVYGFIHQVGLQDYYRLRPEGAGTPAEAPSTHSVFADPEVAKEFLFEDQFYCLLDGLHCPACAWLVERGLEDLPGVQSPRVNYSTQRLSFRPSGNPEEVLPQALRRVEQLGYRAIPYDPNRQERPRSRRERSLLMRFGVAAAAAGNVMLAAFALYSGADLDQQYRPLFHQLCLVLTLPVVGYSAWPFWRGAWNAVCQRSLTTDVSIVLGLSVAFLYSLWGMAAGHQHVYFDLCCTFVFVLLAGRLLEAGARTHAGASLERLLSLSVRTAQRWSPEHQNWEEVPSHHLRLDDRVRVRPGQRVPSDGQVVDGRSYVDQSHLTGESEPRSVSPGDAVFGGSLAVDGCLEVRLTRVGSSSILAQVARLVESTQGSPAPVQRRADRAARLILPGILLLSMLTWAAFGLERALTVLIITCPCALGIATPLVVSLATGVAARKGVLFRDGAALETAQQVTHLVMDKTGTLTSGQLKLERWQAGGDRQALRIAASLEAGSPHPLAQALLKANTEPLLPCEDFRQAPGLGVEGRINGKLYRLGRGEFLQSPPPDEVSPVTLCWLECEGQTVGRFEFSDELRPEVPDFLGRLRERGLSLSLASGDRLEVAAALAGRLNIDGVLGACMPTDKVEWIRQLQARGEVVAFLGDGINDAPALRQADLGIVVANGSELSWEVADVVLLKSGLAPAEQALQMADRAWAHLRANLALATLYNVLAVPAAALGWVTPLVAAVAMPLSSLAVIAQSLLLLRNPEEPHGRSLLSDSSGSAALQHRPAALPVGRAPRPVRGPGGAPLESAL